MRTGEKAPLQEIAGEGQCCGLGEGLGRKLDVGERRG